jgi:hypothetical protein
VQYRPNYWIKYLILEAETTITFLPIGEQDRVRISTFYANTKVSKGTM